MVIPLKSLRESKKMTQQELSNILKVSPSAIGMYENGRRSPDYETLRKISNLFHVSIDYLLSNEQQPMIFSPDETDLVDNYRNLDDKGRDAIWSMMKALTAGSVQPQQSQLAI